MSRDEAWQTLTAAGMPSAVFAETGRFEDREIDQALAALRHDLALDDGPLLAWLWALRSHWPARFAALKLEPDFATAKARCQDWNRALKLRRIAIARLALLI